MASEQSFPAPPPLLGDLLRDWRRRRRLSQLALALDADISQRHLSFLESGRSRPSREMVLRLAEGLSLPLRERNAMLVAAGFAPVYPRRPLDAPDLSAARDAMGRILDGHLPHPALAVDRHWTLLSANDAVHALLTGVADHLLAGPINVLRLSFHPEGLASRILNFREWRAHILSRLSHEAAVSADAALEALLEELKGYPTPPQAMPLQAAPADPAGIAVPFMLASGAGPLSFISATTVFGTAVDVTLSEVTIEAFFPSDQGTARLMNELLADWKGGPGRAGF